MPLLVAPANQILKIVRITGNDKIKKHLQNLGLVTDSELTLLSLEKSGCIIRVNDMRLALDQATAMSIVVNVA